MQEFQTRFLDFVIKNEILRFGEFTLKSGRISPYFFNAGLFNTGEKLAFLAGSYAAAITHANPQFDTLFGPAYKGIPLVSVTAMALAQQHGLNKPYCFNRKETKDHGEGGEIVGAELKGKVLLIDDVITAGTAVREAAEIIAASGASLAGIVVALDRQERGTGQQSAIQEIEQQYQIKVVSVISLQDIIDYLRIDAGENLDTVMRYREEYGIA
ncbi:MAG: orotate phosphoribosyltransferase [Gammaproteobacteria bacterium]